MELGRAGSAVPRRRAHPVDEGLALRAPGQQEPRARGVAADACASTPTTWPCSRRCSASASRKQKGPRCTSSSGLRVWSRRWSRRAATCRPASPASSTPRRCILLLGAPPSILLVGHNVSEIWRGIVIFVAGAALQRAPRRGAHDRRPLSLRPRAEAGAQRRGLEGAGRGGRSAAARGRSAAAAAGRRRRRARHGGDAVVRAPRAGEVGRGGVPLPGPHDARGRPDGNDRRPGEHADEPEELRAARAGDGGRAAGDVLRADPGVRHLGAVREADRELRAEPVGVGAPARARPDQHRRGAVALRPAPARRLRRRRRRRRRWRLRERGGFTAGGRRRSAIGARASRRASRPTCSRTRRRTTRRGCCPTST